MMARRVDSKRRALRNGEFIRGDGYYVYKEEINGKRRTIYAKTLEELREKEDQLHEKEEKGLDLDKQKLTLNDLADTYLASKKKSVQVTTFHTMTSTYDRYVRDNFGYRLVADIKRSHIRDLYLDLLTGVDNRKAISLGTVCRLDSIVKPMFESAVYDDIIIKNPARGVFGEIKKERRDKMKKKPALTEEEQDEFLEFISTTKKHDGIKNMIIVLLGTGCRIGEMIGLRWDDVDFKNNTININHAVGYTKIDGSYRRFIKSTKSAAGDRNIPMLDEVRRALIREKEKQLKLGNPQPVLDGYTNFVFLSERGFIYTRDNICIQIKQLINEYNVEHPYSPLPMFTTHQLRHTFATRLCRNTGDLKSIQNILGHADISTTLNVYADATKDGVKESMESLEGIMFKKKTS